MKKRLLALSLLTAISASASASADGLYIFGDVGQSKFSGDYSDTDTALAVGLGYAINPNFSLELGYHDFGGTNISEVYSGVSIKGSLDASAVQFSAIGKLPLNESFNIYGRLGYSKITIDAKATGTYMGQTYTESDSASDNKAIYGIGADYKINEKLSARAEYIKFGDTDISTFTVGLSYAF